MEIEFYASWAKWIADNTGCFICIPAQSPAQATKLLASLDPEKTYTAEIKIKREKRSLNANAYYRKLCYLLADRLNISSNRAHNLMMRRYGAPAEIDGSLMYTFLPDTDETEETALEMETLHLKPTTNVRDGTDGKRYRAYYVVKGSHEYNTKEMSTLINGIVDECKQVGIETKTPEEVASLLAEYEKAHKGPANR